MGGRRPEGMVDCPRGAKRGKPKLFRYILKTYSYIFVAQAVILTVKRSLKRRKKKIRKEKENIKENQEAADKNLPGVQARCAFFLFCRKYTKSDNSKLILIQKIVGYNTNR